MSTEKSRPSDVPLVEELERDARDEAETSPVLGMVSLVANFPSLRNVIWLTLAFGTLWPVTFLACV